MQRRRLTIEWRHDDVIISSDRGPTAAWRRLLQCKDKITTTTTTTDV